MSTGTPDRLFKLLIGLLTVALVVVFAVSTKETIVEAGDSAPSFELTADDGKPVSTTNFGGKLLVLNFWATWCPPCVQEMPSLNAFQILMQSKGVVVLGVSVDKNATTYESFVKRNVRFKTARDPEAMVSSGYGTYKYPETYVIDTKGKVVMKFVGPENWMDPDLIKKIESLL